MEGGRYKKEEGKKRNEEMNGDKEEKMDEGQKGRKKG